MPRPNRIDLKTLRESRVMTQAELGGQGHVSQYENGRRMPGPAAIRAMAARLGVDPVAVHRACRESMRRARAAAAAAQQSNQSP